MVSLPGTAHAECSCDIVAQDHFLSERVYDMKAIIEDCTGGTHCMTKAVHAARDDVPAGASGADVAKTFYFAPGGDYLITSPIEIVRAKNQTPAGVVFRGEAGSWHPGASEANWGTTFECAVAPGNACITVRDGPSDNYDTYYGFRFEGITMRWSDAVGVSRPDPSAGEYVVGLSLWKHRGSTIRDSRWLDFPGTSILLQNNCNPVYFEHLALVSDEPDSLFAIFLAGAGASNLPSAIAPFLTGTERQVNNSPVISNVYVEGYDTALQVISSTEGKLTDCRFVDQDEASIVLDHVRSWKIRGCHFEYGSSSSADAAVVLDYSLCTLEEPCWPKMADIAVSDCYFDLGCGAGRAAIWARAARYDQNGNFNCGYISTWRARLFVSGCTIVNATVRPLKTSDYANYWQCQANRLVTRTASGGVTVDFFGAAECAPDPVLCPDACGSYPCHDVMLLVPTPPSGCVAL